jgi:signal transduction histidine kinase
VVVEKLEALRVLVGGMAHELNNALSVSMASTEQLGLIVGSDPESAAKAAQRAHGGLSRIRGTIERLKRFALSEDGVLESADLCAMLDFALESAVGRAQSGVAIERRYDEGLPPIDTHIAGLAEALFQVARNAVQAMPKGGTLRATVRTDGDAVVVSVADEGTGIPKGRLAKVFDPYYVRESADTTWSGGRVLGAIPGRSGLGLSAVYGLVSAFGGTVDIQSEVGKGTEVSIRLPRKRSKGSRSARPPPVSPR